MTVGAGLISVLTNITGMSIDPGLADHVEAVRTIETVGGQCTGMTDTAFGDLSGIPLELDWSDIIVHSQ